MKAAETFHYSQKRVVEITQQSKKFGAYHLQVTYERKKYINQNKKKSFIAVNTAA